MIYILCYSINIEIEDHKLYAVVGQVGSGKSSLISAILGEMENLEGKVIVKVRSFHPLSNSPVKQCNGYILTCDTDFTCSGKQRAGK